MSELDKYAKQCHQHVVVENGIPVKCQSTAELLCSRVVGLLDRVAELEGERFTEKARGDACERLEQEARQGELDQMHKVTKLQAQLERAERTARLNANACDVHARKNDELKQRIASMQADRATEPPEYEGEVDEGAEHYGTVEFPGGRRRADGATEPRADDVEHVCTVTVVKSSPNDPPSGPEMTLEEAVEFSGGSPDRIRADSLEFECERLKRLTKPRPMSEAPRDGEFWGIIPFTYDVGASEHMGSPVYRDRDGDQHMAESGQGWTYITGWLPASGGEGET